MKKSRAYPTVPAIWLESFGLWCFVTVILIAVSVGAAVSAALWFVCAPVRLALAAARWGRGRR